MPAVPAPKLEQFMTEAFPHTELSWTIDDVTEDGCVVTSPVAHAVVTYSLAPTSLAAHDPEPT